MSARVGNLNAAKRSMRTATTARPGALGQQERTVLRTLLLDSSLAALPFLASLIAMALATYGDATIRFLISLLFASSVLLAIRFMRRGSQTSSFASVAVIFGFVIWYSYPAVLYLLNPDRWFGYNLPLFIESETVVYSVLSLSFFLLTWVLCYSVLFNRRRTEAPPIAAQSRSSAPNIIIAIALLGVVLGAAPYFLLGQDPVETLRLIFESRAVEKPWLFTENLGNRTSAFVYLAQSFWVAGTCLLLAAAQDKRVRLPLRLVAGAVALISTAIIYFDQGTRSITALILLPALLLFLAPRLSKSRWAALAGIAAMLALVLIFQFQLLFRSSYTRAEVSDSLMTDWTTFRGTSDYFAENMLAFEIVPSMHDYFHESVLAQFLVSPIPRFLWADKPATQLVWYYALIRWGIDIYQVGGNVFPGVVGQFYMSWGWAGIAILGALFGWIAGLTDRWLGRNDPVGNPYSAIVALMLAVWLLLSYRILSPGFFYPILFAWLIVQFVERRHRPDRATTYGRRHVYRPAPRAEDPASNLE